MAQPAGEESEKSNQQLEAAKAETHELITKYGLRLPQRLHLDDPDIKWRDGKPEYTFTDLAFLKGKTKRHEEGSLEELAENMVKSFELEVLHMTDTSQFKTVDLGVTMSTNGGPKFNLKQMIELGTYNTMLANCPKHLYDADKETLESSQKLIGDAFLDGFHWELLEVYSPAPKIAFSWRHWAKFNGEFRGNKGQGQTITIFGFMVAIINEELKITSAEIFYKPNEFLEALMGKRSSDDCNVFMVGCPFIQREHGK